METVSVVITSFDRPDLLSGTIGSFNHFNTYPIKEFIIIDDSGNPKMHEFLRRNYSDYTLILNEKNIGLVESIDKAYAQVTADYIFHTEDDYEFYREGFIEKSLEVLKNDSTLMQVWIRAGDDTSGQPVLLTKFKTPNDTEYRIMGADPYQEWYGFCFQCGLRKKEVYNRVKPYSQWSPSTDFLSQRECKIGIELWRLGYRAAILMQGYAKHTGFGRSTCGNQNK